VFFILRTYIAHKENISRNKVNLFWTLAVLGVGLVFTGINAGVFAALKIRLISEPLITNQTSDVEAMIDFDLNILVEVIILL